MLNGQIDCIPGLRVGSQIDGRIRLWELHASVSHLFDRVTKARACLGSFWPVPGQHSVEEHNLGSHLNDIAACVVVGSLGRSYE